MFLDSDKNNFFPWVLNIIVDSEHKKQIFVKEI